MPFVEYVIQLFFDNPLYIYDDFVFLLHSCSGLSYEECERIVDEAIGMLGKTECKVD